MDTTHEGIRLAEEAVRDIAREERCGRVRAARVALAGMSDWERGTIKDALWPEVLVAAASQLRAIIAHGRR